MTLWRHRSGATAGSDSATPTASTAMTITADHHTPIPPRLRALKLSVEVASSSGSFRKEREVLVTESVIGENGFAPELEEYLRAQRQEARKATGSSVMGAVFNVVGGRGVASGQDPIAWLVPSLRGPTNTCMHAYICIHIHDPVVLHLAVAWTGNEESDHPKAGFALQCQ